MRTPELAEGNLESNIVHATCVVERSLFQQPSVVFQALSEADKLRRWMGPGEGSTLIDFQCEFVEGGLQVLRYLMGPDTPIPGVTITNQGRFLCITPRERIVMASTMKRGEWIFSASLVTFELLLTESGTDLIITHQGAFFEGSDGPTLRDQGWNVLADRLALVVAEQMPITAGA